MSNRRNAVLAGLAAGCLVFVCLAVATRLPTLDALILAVAGGGAVLAAVARRPQESRPPVESAPVAEVVPPQPAQFQTQPITSIRLPTALADYHFGFAANVLWRPSAEGIRESGDIAVNEIIRRACKITKQRDPSEATLAAADLSVALGVLLPDLGRQVEVRAESVHLQLPPEDQKRLDEFATLRKEEGLWEYQRRYQASKRHHLRTDVLKDAGSAVVWWLAKHEDNLEEVAANIDVLTQLANAANKNHTNNTDSAAFDAPAGPPTPAERFDAFLDSLDPAPSDDVRLMLTSQVARLVDGHDQKAADEMRRRHSEPDGGDEADGYWDYPGEAEGTPPE
ncbi:MAG: hypothetical protein JWM19_1916 [Actinomycetia bacterium]|nr:hypothetical protein [Actinomycetes bacterium]